MRLVLFEPEIPQNAGSMMRLAAALGVALDVVEPCGFVLDDRRLRRAGMDYLDHLEMRRHASWDAFLRDRVPGRLVLLSARAHQPYTSFRFRTDDLLIVGRESSGATDAVRAAADHHLRVPLRPPARSINVALAAAMVLGEALRQTVAPEETE